MTLAETWRKVESYYEKSSLLRRAVPAVILTLSLPLVGVVAGTIAAFVLFFIEGTFDIPLGRSTIAHISYLLIIVGLTALYYVITYTRYQKSSSKALYWIFFSIVTVILFLIFGYLGAPLADL